MSEKDRSDLVGRVERELERGDSADDETRLELLETLYRDLEEDVDETSAPGR